MKNNEIKFIDRETGKLCTETVMGDGALRFAYETLLGRTLWFGLFYSRWLSSLFGKYYDSKLSRRNIPQLANLPGLQLQEAEKDWPFYNSFNDFFTRRLKSGMRQADTNPDVICAPADGRLLLYPEIESNAQFPVKGAVRSLEYLCNQSLPEKKYHAAVFRLAPVDYHRFHYPCDCKQNASAVHLAGKYHSVNPVAFKKVPDVFVENTRSITELDSPVFGKIFYIEVGAFGVGSIVQTAESGDHKKMDEKGFFKFGGSTVILLMDADKVVFDADLLKNSANGVETLIRCGNRIGIKKQ